MYQKLLKKLTEGQPEIFASIQEFNNQRLEYEDLSKIAQNIHRKAKTITRIGFDPDIVIPVAGVTFDGRQETLFQMQQYGYFDAPVSFHPEPTNKYDKYAISIMAGTYKNQMSGEWCMGSIGYVPKRICQECGVTFGGKKTLSEYCPICKEYLSEQINLNVFFSGFIKSDGILQVGLIGIYKAAGTKSYGVRLGIKFDKKQSSICDFLDKLNYMKREEILDDLNLDSRNIEEKPDPFDF